MQGKHSVLEWLQLVYAKPVLRLLVAGAKLACSVGSGLLVLLVSDFECRVTPNHTCSWVYPEPPCLPASQRDRCSQPPTFEQGSCVLHQDISVFLASHKIKVA
jgi:hypothetical protein